MKKITVGQIVLVTVLSQSVIGCLSGGGGGSVSSTTPVVSTPGNGSDAPSNGGSNNPGNQDGGSMPEIPAGQAKMTSQDQQSILENNGQVTIRGEHLDQVSIVRLRGIRSGSATDGVIQSQDASHISFDASFAPMNDAYKIIFVAANGVETETGRYFLNSREMAQVSSANHFGKLAGHERVACMVMKDSSLQCIGKHEVVQFQGHENEIHSVSYLNHIHEVANKATSAFGSWDATGYTVFTPKVLDSSYTSFQTKASNENRSFVIRDVNNNPVLNVAEVVVYDKGVCYRKLDNTVYCYGSFFHEYFMSNQLSMSGLVFSLLNNDKALDYDLIMNNIVIPKQIFDKNGVALKATSLLSGINTTYLNKDICAVQENTNKLFCLNQNFNASTNTTSLGVDELLSEENQSILVAENTSTNVVKVSNNQVLVGRKGLTVKINDVISNIKSAVYKHSTQQYFIVTEDSTKVYSCLVGVSLFCNTLVYSAANSTQNIRTIKGDTHSVCIQDMSSRIKCLGSKVFAGTEVGAGTDTTNVFMDFVGKDVSTGKAASLADFVWDIGILGENTNGFAEIKMWGLSYAGTSGAGLSLNNDPYTKGTHTDLTTSMLQSRAQLNESQGKGKIIFNVRPEAIVQDYSIPAL